MAKIDELIQKAQDELNKAKDEDKPAAQAKLDALKSAKAAGIEMDNTEVNGLVTRKTSEVDDKWKGLVGMERDKLGELLEDETLQSLFAEISAVGDGGEGGDGSAGDKPPLERFREELRSRDSKIENLSTSLSDVNRRYSKDKVEVAVEKAFRDAGLKDDFLDPAKRLAAYDDLIEKVTKGESVTNEEIAEKVNSVKTLSEVWFKAEGDEENGSGSDGRTIETDSGKYKLKDDAEVVVRPHIPATPNGKDSAEITDQDRAARASSAY